MRYSMKMLVAVAVVGAYPYGQAAEAQYVYPVSPGNFVTGNPSPSYNPNAVVSSTNGGIAYWDPYKGWVTKTQNTTYLNSYTSPGRTPAPGSSVQYYNEWDGTRWVRGTRWLGQDGQWHGNHWNTVVGPNGSTQTQMTGYAARPRVR